MIEPCFLNISYDQCHVGLDYGFSYVRTLTTEFIGLCFAIGVPTGIFLGRRAQQTELKDRET